MVTNMDYYDNITNEYLDYAGKNSRFSVSKVEVLSHDEFVLFEITDDIVYDSDKLSSTYAQGVQCKFDFEIVNKNHKYNIEEDNVFWYDKKIKYFKGLKDPSSGNVYWFTKGVFAVTDASTKGDVISISCVDKFGLLTSDTGASCLELPTKIEAGYKVGKMIEDFLNQDKGNGLKTDPVPPLIDKNAEDIELGEDLELAVGSYFGELMIELANNIRCRIFYNKFGRMVLTKTDVISKITDKAPVWSFNDETDNFYMPSEISYDFSKVKNRITVWGESFDGTTYVSTVTDTNPKSPVCVQKVGYRVADTVEDLFGYEQKNVDAFAKAYLEMQSVVGLSINLECTAIPHLEIEDIVQVTDKKLNIDGDKFIISGISYEGSKMKLSLSNVDSYPSIEEFHK